MNIVFLNENPLTPEKGGTSRATDNVKKELERRGNICYGNLYTTRKDKSTFFYNEHKIDNLLGFLNDKNIKIVINQIAFSQWLLKTFLANGGQQWVNAGGKIISVMHFDPPAVHGIKLYYWRHFDNFKNKSLTKKITCILLLFVKPLFYCHALIKRTNDFKYIYKNSNIYVLLSKTFINDFTRISKIKDTSKIRIIPNMLTFPDIEKPEIINKKNKTVLVVSRMEEKQKQISLILKIWKSIHEYNGYILKIVGDGPDLDYYKNYAEKYKINNISFEGQQSPLKYYKEASIFLMTSRYEGWGLTITESMQNAVIPIVLNTTSVFADIITDGVDGYLPRSEKEMCSILRKLLFDEKLRYDLAINALKSVTRFRPNIIGNTWENILNSLSK